MHMPRTVFLQRYQLCKLIFLQKKLIPLLPYEVHFSLKRFTVVQKLTFFAWLSRKERILQLASYWQCERATYRRSRLQESIAILGGKNGLRESFDKSVFLSKHFLDIRERKCERNKTRFVIFGKVTNIDMMLSLSFDNLSNNVQNSFKVFWRYKYS